MTAMSEDDDARSVLDFWFGAPGSPEHGRSREAWFRKDAAFDAEIAARFGALIERALGGALAAWSRQPRSALAEIVVLDQFTRNVFRGTPKAFAGDARALAAARRGCRARLDHECRIAGDPVGLGSACLAEMEMPGEQQIDAALREDLERRTRAADQVDVARLVGEVERVVGDDDLGHRRAEWREAAADRRHLLVVDAPVLERQRARGVDADDGDLVVDEGRLEVGRDHPPVLAERAQEPLPDAIERHVVVARNDDRRCPDAGEEIARLLELRLLRALRQVARDDDDIGPDRFDTREQRLDQSGIDAAEVQVGEMDDRSHRGQGEGAFSGAPATTVRLAARMR